MAGFWRSRPSGSMQALQREEEGLGEKMTGIITYRRPEGPQEKNNYTKATNHQLSI